MKLMHASLGARICIERIFRTAEVQQSSFTPVCESGGTLKAVLITMDCIENAVPHLHKTSTITKTTIWNSLDTQTDMNKLHATSSVLKTVLHIFPDTQTGLYELHRTHTTSTVLKIALYIFPDTQTGLHELHSTSTLVETAFNVPTDTDKHDCTSLDLNSSENTFVSLS